MKKTLFTFLLLFIAATIQAQNIELLYQSDDFRTTVVVEEFEDIDYQMDISALNKIASYKLHIDKQGKYPLSKAFAEFKSTANSIGANAFCIESVELNNGQYIVLADVYYLNDALMQTNFSFYEENLIVIFGDLNTKNEIKTKGCKVNKEKVNLLPYSYTTFRNEIGEKTKIAVGSFLGGESLTITGRPNRLGECFSLGGVYVAPGGIAIGYGSGGGMGVGVGISIKTGSLYPMDLSFGLFVMTILDSTKENAEETQTVTE